MGRTAARAVLVVILLVLSVAPAAVAQPRPAVGPGDGPSITLVDQTPVVSAGGSFAVRFRLDEVPADGSLQVVVHQRVRSRSELALSMDGEGLRSEALRTATDLAALPADADGVRELRLSLAPGSGVLSLQTEGVYPVELIAQDAAAAPLATIVTHLVLGPDDGDDAPALGVAVVAEVRAPPALQPDSTVRLSPTVIAALGQLVAGLAAGAGPVTLDIGPETIDALRASGGDGAAVVDDLADAARGRAVLATPYVDVSPDGLAAADLLSELGPQLAAGAVALERLGGTPVRDALRAPSDLGQRGLEGLVYTGVRALVLDPEQVEAPEPGTIRYSLAQPFLVAAGDSPTVPALVTDPVIEERLATEGSPGLIVSRVLSELALLRLEQPSVARSVVLPLEPGLDATTVELLLAGLGAGRPFEAMDLPGAVDHADPLLDGGGNEVERSLIPTEADTVPTGVADTIRAVRADLTTFAGMLGGDPAQLDALSRHLLVAEAGDLTTSRRQAHLDVVDGTIDGIAAQVTTPPTFTLTLTARDGTIPLTIGNGTDLPLRVTVHLRSQKLEFPDGDTIDLVLTETNTRLDIRVRALASGAFPLEVDVTSPDGQRRLSMSTFTVRSTAVSGAGLILSLGAGLFLVVWWARHWHRTRRSTKLVGAHVRTDPGT